MQRQFNVNEQLLESGLKMTGLKNADELVNFALQQLLQRESQRKLLELEGMIDWQGDFSVVSQWNDVCEVEPKTF
jgi:Arc/MetJ family transcription regulator